MNKTIYSVITGTGSYVPTRSIKNENFLSSSFYDTDGKKLEKTNKEIIDKFEEITTIAERRYVTDDLMTSDIACFAAREAISTANIDREELDYIIVAHNFGNTPTNSRQADTVPSIAARVKHLLEIKNPHTVAYDILFGCPGWLQAVIQADYFIKSGDAKKILVIGAEILSRVYDPHDRDGMLYADGAGAVILEGKMSVDPIGILAHGTRSDTLLYSKMLYMDKSYQPERADKNDIFLKMNGRKLYQYALEKVPQAIKDCLEKSKIHLNEISKILMHQANGKMDEAILKRLYQLFDIKKAPENVMPMIITQMGNSSVATIPTLLDRILKNKLEKQQIEEGDALVFASVGAGMNINALVYRV